MARTTGFDNFYFTYADSGEVIISTKTKGYSEADILINEDGTKFDARKREWFKETMMSGESTISKPYVDAISKTLMISFSQPVFENKKIIGIVSGDLPLDTFANNIRNFKFSQSARILLFEDLFYVTPGKFILEESGKPFIDALNEGMQEKKGSFEYHSALDNEKRFASCDITSIGWKVCLTNSHRDYAKELNAIAWLNFMWFFGGFVVVLVAVYFILTHLLKPLEDIKTNLSNFFKYLNYKKEDYKPIIIKSKDEFKEIANYIDAEIETIRKLRLEEKAMQNDINDIAKEAADGRFGKMLIFRSKDPNLNALKDSINEMSQTLCHTISPDIARILQIFKDAKNQIFKGQITEPVGIEEDVNALIASIVTMLKTSSELANTLNSYSDDLNESVLNLEKSSQEQADFLISISDATEQISSSMTTMSQRGEDVVRQSEDIVKIVSIIKDIS